MENLEEVIKKFIAEKVNSKLDFDPREVAKIKPFFEDELTILDNLKEVRTEICYCIFFGLHQAAITLTNHLLEDTLKTGLLYSEYGVKLLDDLNEMDTFYKEGLDKYSSLDLSGTINRSCSKGLITKPEKKILHEFRERLRNGFSHSDSRKIFKDIKVPFYMGSFGNINKEPLNFKECSISDIPQFQGLAKSELAKNHSFDYFNCVYGILKRIENKLNRY
ncbi:hypothetical protein PXD56_17315 [Maribacter sp. SA7]|uniref:hypothetical protein n=1 Tax=Maribacter zhoushanensis TaxID=3030012 RepID=UPI0023EB72CC|nr:hypothetical protein [Maribacter zhoushanensis]MDF4204733.1 hypothetical protein [Maribacter zhoushanensis]